MEIQSFGLELSNGIWMSFAKNGGKPLLFTLINACHSLNWGRMQFKIIWVGAEFIAERSCSKSMEFQSFSSEFSRRIRMSFARNRGIILQLLFIHGKCDGGGQFFVS